MQLSRAALQLHWSRTVDVRITGPLSEVSSTSSSFLVTFTARGRIDVARGRQLGFAWPPTSERLVLASFNLLRPPTTSTHSMEEQ